MKTWRALLAVLGSFSGRSAAAAAALSVAFGLNACGSALRTPSKGPQRPDGAELVQVGYPPPPASIEEVPPDPGAPCVWLDGHWHWSLGRWLWKGGSWVLPPKGCYYAEPTLMWLPTGQAGELAYMAPRWYPLTVSASASKPAKACASVTACPLQHVDRERPQGALGKTFSPAN